MAFFSLTLLTYQWCNCGETQKLLGVHITEDLIWTLNTCLAQKAQQHIHFLHKLKRANLPPFPPPQGVSRPAVSLSGLGVALSPNEKTLQWNGRTAEKIIRISTYLWHLSYHEYCICNATMHYGWPLLRPSWILHLPSIWQNNRICI